MKATQPGNQGTFAFCFSDPEITPSTAKAGVIAFNSSDAQVDDVHETLSAETEVRAVVEGQFLSMRLHAERLGVKQPQRLIVVGGASSNACMLQVLADVFNTPVYRLSSATNSAALGGAFRAQHGLACGDGRDGRAFVPFERSAGLDFALAARPDAEAAKVYSASLPRFEKLEARAVELLR